MSAEQGASMAKTVELAVAAVDDAYADFFAVALQNQWTDGLPVIPPTPKRVDLLLDTVDRDPDDVIAVMPPGKGRRLCGE
jgi:hypothetical protein